MRRFPNGATRDFGPVRLLSDNFGREPFATLAPTPGVTFLSLYLTISHICLTLSHYLGPVYALRLPIPTILLYLLSFLSLYTHMYIYIRIFSLSLESHRSLVHQSTFTVSPILITHIHMHSHICNAYTRWWLPHADGQPSRALHPHHHYRHHTTTIIGATASGLSLDSYRRSLDSSTRSRRLMSVPCVRKCGSVTAASTNRGYYVLPSWLATNSTTKYLQAIGAQDVSRHVPPSICSLSHICAHIHAQRETYARLLCFFTFYQFLILYLSLSLNPILHSLYIYSRSIRFLS